MSLEKVKTELLGYEQIFPNNLDALNKISENSRIDTRALLQHKLGACIEGFFAPDDLLEDYPTTADGYTWFCGLKFKVGGGEVAVLYPSAQDWDKEDGSQNDRSIAIYEKGDVSDSEIEALVESLCERYLAYEAELKELANRN